MRLKLLGILSRGQRVWYRAFYTGYKTEPLLLNEKRINFITDDITLKSVELTGKDGIKKVLKV